MIVTHLVGANLILTHLCIALLVITHLVTTYLVISHVDITHLLEITYSDNISPLDITHFAVILGYSLFGENSLGNN